MDIAHLHVDLPPIARGGVAYQVDLLARALTRQGHRVSVMTTSSGPADAPYEVLRVGPKRSVIFPRVRRQYEVAWRFSRAISKLEGASVHTHGDDWLLPSSLHRVRTFYGSALEEANSSSSYLRKGAQRLQHQLHGVSARLATVTVAISESSRRGMAIDHVIPCAVDETVFGVEDARQLSSSPNILFVAGSMGGRKRGHLLLDAFKDVRQRWADATLHLVTRDAVSAPGVTTYSGIAPSVLAELYAQAWILASPSSYEGFGVPYAEALMAGVPIIATQNPGAEEVLERGRLGVLSTPTRFASDIVALLDDDERRHDLAMSGKLASARYASQLVARRYVELYKSLA